MGRRGVILAILAAAFVVPATAAAHAVAVSASVGRWAPSFGNRLSYSDRRPLYVGFARWEAVRHVWLQAETAYWRSEGNAITGDDGTSYGEAHETLIVPGVDVLYALPLTRSFRMSAGAGVTLHRWTGLPSQPSPAHPDGWFSNDSAAIGYEGIGGVSWKPTSHVSLDAELRFIHGRRIDDAYGLDPSRSYSGWTSGAIGLTVWP